MKPPSCSIDSRSLSRGFNRTLKLVLWRESRSAYRGCYKVGGIDQSGEDRIEDNPPESTEDTQASYEIWSPIRLGELYSHGILSPPVRGASFAENIFRRLLYVSFVRVSERVKEFSRLSLSS